MCDSKWQWTTTHDQAYQKAKELLQSSSLLVHFDPQKPLILLCDASPYSIGPVLAHRMSDNSEKLCHTKSKLVRIILPNINLLGASPVTRCGVSLYVNKNVQTTCPKKRW